jgi:soluble lytic murein transglycosylase-like protein
LSLAPGRLTAAAAYSQELKPQGAADWNAANGAKRLTRGANLERESAEALADPGVKGSEEMVKESDQAAKKPQGLSGSDIDTIVNKVGQALGLDPSLIKAVIKTESNFNHKAVSPAGAQGLMQLMPGTAREMGVKDPFSPLDNIWGGARYLKRMLDSHGGNLNRALAAYNWGPGNLQKYGNKRMPRETRRYIEVVNRNYANFKKQTSRA